MTPRHARTFNIPKVEGISEKTMTTHLALYEGYVKNLNGHYQALQNVCKENSEDVAIVSAAITKRIGFELAGVLNHERFLKYLKEVPLSVM